MKTSSKPARKTIIVPGQPVGQPRPRARNMGNKAGIYTPRGPAYIYRQNIAKVARAARWKPLPGPVEIRVGFFFRRPKSKTWSTKPMPPEPWPKLPDVDNALKCVLDALNHIAYEDDRQVVNIHACKLMCAGDTEPHTRIEVLPVETG